MKGFHEDLADALREIGTVNEQHPGFTTNLLNVLSGPAVNPVNQYQARIIRALRAEGVDDLTIHRVMTRAAIDERHGRYGGQEM